MSSPGSSGTAGRPPGRTGVHPAPSAEPAVKQVAVTEAKFYWVEDPYLPFPVVELTATNRSDTTLAKLYLHGSLSLSPGGPSCLDQDFCVSVPEGIPAGQSRHMVLLPSVLTAWGDPQTQYHPNLPFTLTVLNAAGREGKLLREQPGTDALSELPVLVAGCAAPTLAAPEAADKSSNPHSLSNARPGGST